MVWVWLHRRTALVRSLSTKPSEVSENREVFRDFHGLLPATLPRGKVGVKLSVWFFWQLDIWLKTVSLRSFFDTAFFSFMNVVPASLWPPQQTKLGHAPGIQANGSARVWRKHLPSIRDRKMQVSQTWTQLHAVKHKIPSIQARNQFGTLGGRRVFWEEPKFLKLCPIVLNYVQHIFPGEANIFLGWASPPWSRVCQYLSFLTKSALRKPGHDLLLLLILETLHNRRRLFWAKQYSLR